MAIQSRYRAAGTAADPPVLVPAAWPVAVWAADELLGRAPLAVVACGAPEEVPPAAVVVLDEDPADAVPPLPAVDRAPAPTTATTATRPRPQTAATT
jgi:hypothetical protein